MTHRELKRGQKSVSSDIKDAGNAPESSVLTDNSDPETSLLLEMRSRRIKESKNEHLGFVSVPAQQSGLSASRDSGSLN